MITHNGTYLLHATHHGMPIVAATMGGKMVFGVSLLPATKQAIVAAFGAEGTEVIAKTNDYLNRIATTDPARALLLAGFINEDPLLVCSLVETSKTRWLVGDGKGYFKTTFRAAYYADSYAYRMKYIFMDDANQSFIGATDSQSGPAFGQLFKSGNQSQVWGQYNWKKINFDRDNITGEEYEDYIRFDIKNNSANRRYLEQDHIAMANMSKVTQAPAYIFAYNNGGVGTQATKGWLAVCELYGNDNLVANFVPYRDPSTGEMELLDILTGTLATRVGTFTEQLTDKTPA